MQHDPYIDKDGDGWVPGPQYQATGYTELLFLFRDPNDSDPKVQPDLPADVWKKVSGVFLSESLKITRIRAAAQRLGILYPAAQQN